MGRRKEPERLDREGIRQAMLRGLIDPTGVYLFDQAMQALDEKGQANFMTALQLRDACQWTAAINAMQAEMHRLIACGEAEEKRVAALIRNKQAAEDARRRILDGLGLTPQKKRGRPENPETEREKREGEDAGAAADAWAAFDGGDEGG